VKALARGCQIEIHADLFAAASAASFVPCLPMRQCGIVELRCRQPQPLRVAARSGQRSLFHSLGLRSRASLDIYAPWAYIS